MNRRLRPIHLLIALLMVATMGCKQEQNEGKPSQPTLRQAADGLQQHGVSIIESLRAMNPSAADQAMHDAMYLADHLPDFTSETSLDKEKLEDVSSRLNRLLLQAHNGAHGSNPDWEPKSAADELEATLKELSLLLK